MNKKDVSIHALMDVIGEKLKQGGTVELTVTGQSMFPFFRDKQTSVLISPIIEPLKRFDVVFYHDHDAWILHRIIRTTDHEYVICGDGRKVKEYISGDQILGKVISHTHHQKVVNEQNRCYRFKVWLWYMLFPIRLLLLRMIRVFTKNKR